MRMEALISLALTLSAIAIAADAPDRATKPIMQYVETQHAFARGLTNGRVDRFLGIPYAASPTGDLRWRPPAPAPSWASIQDATKMGSECIQPSRRSQTTQPTSGSEDCLYLNVYRPAGPEHLELLPVLLFIHGGSNQKGAGNDYDPSEMTAKGHIIVVTINYRLNVLGWLALPALDAEAGEPSSGNFGLLDQQAAMRWVDANIQSFGGDPQKITVAGESAGAIDLCGSLVSPKASGLFSSAILESVYCPSETHDDAILTGAPVAAALGCTDSQSAAPCMRGKKPAELLAAAGRLSVEPGGGKGFNASPNAGNSILPVQPTDALRSGNWNRSTILIGSNHDESALFVGPALVMMKEKLPLTATEYQDIIKKRFGARADAVLAEYPAANYSSPFIALSDLATDPSPLGCQITPLAQLLASTTSVYRYEFDDPRAPVPAILPRRLSLGAYHGSELQYLFGMTLLPGPNTQAQQELSNRMIRYWGNFAKRGDTNAPELTSWPQYSSASPNLLLLRPEGDAVVDNFDADHHCPFWTQFRN